MVPVKSAYTGSPFSKRNQLARIIWSVIYLFFFRYSPRPFHGWRSLLLRLFGAKIGKEVHIYPAVKIWAPWNIEIDDHAGVGNGATLYAQDKIKIGKMSVVSQGAYLSTGTHDYTSRGFPLYTKPITVGDRAWIAAEAFVHPGVTIGEGTVIGARSVVTKDMPDWMVCSGFPCKPIKPRTLTD